jgi:ferredoxin
VEEEFNAGSRLVGGRAAHFGAVPGAGSGEGRTGDAAVPAHAIRILNPATGQDVRVVVPEDRYILHEAEEQGLLLPYACRMGCCTACAVRVTEADGSAVGGAGSAVSTTTPPLLQPESLGIAAELRARGFALMCVSRPTRAVTLTLAEEDELYDLQFGDAFDEIATNPDGPGVERDDFALEIANMDE